MEETSSASSSRRPDCLNKADKLILYKEILQSKGYLIVDEFGCAAFDTNRFLKYFGGINKARLID